VYWNFTAGDRICFKGLNMARSIAPILTALAMAIWPLQATAQDAADVLILGDSQISFGAGKAYLDFFKNLPQNCSNTSLQKAEISKLGARRTLAVGVRSTSLHSWIARSGASKDTICEVDKKYGVNAGAYGIVGQSGRKFIQIGKEPGFDYCTKGQSAFETVFSQQKHTPKLVVLNFLGNAEGRWINNQAAADADVRATFQQIPKDVPCVVLTTAPVFKKATNDRRMQAQNRLKQAIETHGNQCQIVEGFTAQTRNAIEGQSRFFRRNDSGRVTDPHHPNNGATRQFVKLIGPKLCEAIGTELK
jgi:hypothetical protein